MTGGPPPFKQARTVAAYRTPEELFYALAGRAKSHAYLRGPQQDVLREYVAHSDDADVAFELPTGTGKTTVGLVIADWKRRQGMRCAFLALTNQLAGQVLAEGERLGIECADLRGRKGERNPAEEGRFLTGTATGVSVYSNLFNVKPVIKGCDFLVFDDAHGGEQYVSGMWTVSIGVEETPELYNEVLVALKPVLSESQIRSLLDRSASSVELADVWSDVGVLPKLAGAKRGRRTPISRTPGG
jgi:hypothetical protein